MPIKYRELARRIQLEGLPETVEHLSRALMEGQLNFEDFKIRDLAEATVMTKDGEPCGREWVDSFNPARGESTLMESASAVDSTAFATIMGQLIYSATMQAATASEFIYPKLERVISSKLRRELIPGVTGISEDMEDDVQEGMPYPEVGFGEDYVETPLTTKKGRILSITKETIFFDRTGLVQQAANGIGGLLGRRREKSFCRIVAGIVNNYKWKGTTYNTYQTAAPWINVKSSNGITTTDGWVKIDAVEQLFNNMTDPNTGEPVEWTINQLLAMPARRHQFRKVLGATINRSSQATSGNHESTEGPNTVENYPILFSRWLYAEIVASGVSTTNAADWWFAGDFKKAFAWVENWPITTVQAPSNHESEFKNDIVYRSKTSMMGVHAVMEPRAAAKSYQA